MRLEHCVTRNHIEVWNERVLPPGAVRVTFWKILRGSLLPIAVWAGVGCFVSFVYHPVAAAVLGGFFTAFFLLGVVLRRRARHSVRCSVYGAVAGVFDKSMHVF
ncbi:hypothetical protein [Streptomyces sp. NBC_01506]|uniref:hypothetical protein n=1 Tax=Streptomyces sp. NBC_01506 TaxID=2903887 RepID=UPI003865DCFE